MREPIKIERMKVTDAGEMADWIAKLSHRNNVDVGIFDYPATSVLKASNGKPIMYMPRQQVTMLESLAINPDAQGSDVALALRALLQVVEYDARNAGQGELMFACKDEDTCRFAEAHGMEKMDFTFYRRKL